MIIEPNSDLPQNETNKTSWSSNCSRFPDIEPHTKEKHLILESYLKDWIVTLCANHPLNSGTLTIVDGFCGGGYYYDKETNSNWNGSPLRILEAVDLALKEIREKRSKPNFQLDIKVYFIDSNNEHTECLKNYLKITGLDAKYSKYNYEIVHQEFSSFLNLALPEIKKRKGSTFFFIDPFGYTQYSMEDIRKIMNLNKSEILLTFMIEFFKRFLKNREAQLFNLDRLLEARDYFAYGNLKDISSVKQQAYLRDETLRLFRDKGDVRYIYSFGMLQSSTSVKYYLIHFANHLKAQAVIKDTLWKYNNIDLSYQFSYGVYGLGFRTPEYFEQNLKLFDIKNENYKKCIMDLEEGLLPLVYEAKDGIPFLNLIDSTIQKNPANISIYRDFIIKARSEKEIKIKRDGKNTRAKNFKNTDIVIKSNEKEYFLFDMSKYYKDK